MTSDAQLDAAVRRVLGELLLEGDPYTSLPLVDPVTKLPPAPTVDAIRGPLEEAVTDLDETVGNHTSDLASLDTLVTTGRLAEDALSTTFVRFVDQNGALLPAGSVTTIHVNTVTGEIDDITFEEA